MEISETKLYNIGFLAHAYVVTKHPIQLNMEIAPDSHYFLSGLVSGGKTETLYDNVAKIINDLDLFNFLNKLWMVVSKQQREKQSPMLFVNLIRWNSQFHLPQS